MGGSAVNCERLVRIRRRSGQHLSPGTRSRGSCRSRHPAPSPLRRGCGQKRTGRASAPATADLTWTTSGTRVSSAIACSCTAVGPGMASTKRVSPKAKRVGGLPRPSSRTIRRGIGARLMRRRVCVELIIESVLLRRFRERQWHRWQAMIARDLAAARIPPGKVYGGEAEVLMDRDGRLIARAAMSRVRVGCLASYLHRPRTGAARFLTSNDRPHRSSAGVEASR
jgi:hypothetical protein